MKTKEIENTLSTIIAHIERNPSMANIQHIENLTRHALQQVKSVDLADVVGRSEQLPCDECVDGQRWSPYYGKYVECDCRK